MSGACRCNVCWNKNTGVEDETIKFKIYGDARCIEGLDEEQGNEDINGEIGIWSLWYDHSSLPAIHSPRFTTSSLWFMFIKPFVWFVSVYSKFDRWHINNRAMRKCRKTQKPCEYKRGMDVMYVCVCVLCFYSWFIYKSHFYCDEYLNWESCCFTIEIRQIFF